MSNFSALKDTPIFLEVVSITLLLIRVVGTRILEGPRLRTNTTN